MDDGTTIEYGQKDCAVCARFDKDLERFRTPRKGVAIRKIDLAVHRSDKSAMRDFRRRTWFTPCVVIYGVDGKQIRADDGGMRRGAYLLYDWLEREFARERETTG